MIDGEIVARAKVPAVRDDTAYFLASGKADAAVAAYVEWVAGTHLNDGGKLAWLLA